MTALGETKAPAAHDTADQPRCARYERAAFGRSAEVERVVEARVAIRARREAIAWRFRLVLIESAMLGLLVLVAGVLLKQPLAMILRGATIVASGCLGTGLLLIALSAAAGHGLTGLRKRWGR